MNRNTKLLLRGIVLICILSFAFLGMIHKFKLDIEVHEESLRLEKCEQLLSYQEDSEFAGELRRFGCLKN